MSAGAYLCFWAGLCLIVWTSGVRTESPVEETKPSTVKECRVHIEKALEQYWDKKETKKSDEKTTSSSSTLDDDKDRTFKFKFSPKYKDYLAKQKSEESTEKDNFENVLENPKSEIPCEEIKEDKNKNKEDKIVESQSDNAEEKLKKPSHVELDDDDDDDDGDDNDDATTSSDMKVKIDSADKKLQQSVKKQTQGSVDDGVNDLKSKDNIKVLKHDASKTHSDIKQNSKIQIVDLTKDKSENKVALKQEEKVVSSIESDDDDENRRKGEEKSSKEPDKKKEEKINLSVAGKQEGKPKDLNVTSSASSDAPKEVKPKEEPQAFLKDKPQPLSKEKPQPSLKEEPQTLATEKTPLHLKEQNPPLKEDKTQSTLSADAAQKVSKDTDNKGIEEVSKSSDDDDDSIENIYEDEADTGPPGKLRSREHVDVILGLDEVDSELEKEEEKLAQVVFKDIKKIQTTQIRPIEMLYKYADSTTQVLGDAELFNKPMIVFLGPWSAGKTSIINYILGIEKTPRALKTGTGITDVDFTLVTHGKQDRIISGTELAADWRYSGVQRFGQGFLDHFRSIHIPHALLEKVILVDTPGILESKKNTERGYPLRDAFQWFIERADVVYVVLDPSRVDIGSELAAILEMLPGRETRFLLNKADSVRRSDLMRVVGQLFWNLSPLMSGSEAPLIYAVSLTSLPYQPSAPARFLEDQERNFLRDMRTTLEKRVENKILYARRHAVRVRNHAKMIDCYLASFYRHKSIFSSKRNVAKLITDNPREYHIYDGMGGMTNVTRNDMPNPMAYKEFFKHHPLYDFKPLASTCSYFRGCPMDKLDSAIMKEIPELLAKYQTSKRALHEDLEQKR